MMISISTYGGQGGGGVLGWVEWRVKEEGGKQLKDDGYLAFESE